MSSSSAPGAGSGGGALADAASSAAPDACVSSMPTPAAGDCPVAESWQVFAAQQQDALGAISRNLLPAPALHILRSSQLDAQRLDVELAGLLQEQALRLFTHAEPGRAADFEPEMGLLLGLAVFLLSVWRGRAPPGAQLLNLRYRNERAAAQVGPGRTGVEGPGLSMGQRLGWCAGSVLLPYAWQRLTRTAGQGEWSDSDRPALRRAWRALRWAEGLWAGAALANSAAFLRHGTYRSLLERLLGARLVWKEAVMTRIISFEYLNRQLVWQELGELLLCVLPLLSGPGVRRAVSRYLPRPPSASTPAATGGGNGGTSAAAFGSMITIGAAAPGGDVREQEQQHSATVQHPTSRCPVCGCDDILTPFTAHPCGHVFCYYCIQTNCQADAYFCCPFDGVRVRGVKRWNRRREAAAKT